MYETRVKREIEKNFDLDLQMDSPTIENNDDQEKLEMI